jgi:hypothetical protein
VTEPGERAQAPAMADPAPVQSGREAKGMDRGELIAMAALSLALLAYGVWFIYRSSALIGGQRYFLLFDDAMISMTYAKNVVDGYGLAWSRWGAPVEGFTCPLWTLLMVPVHLLPLSDALRPLVVQGVGLAVLLLGVWVVRALVGELAPSADRPGARGARIVACALTAGYYPLAYWSLLGMETGLQSLLITLIVLLSLRARRGQASYPALFALYAVAVLLRPDMILAVGLSVVALVLGGPLRLRHARRWALCAVAAAGAVAAYQAFRVNYYGAWLPNTYYLKMTGIDPWIRAARGLSATLDFVRPFAVLAVVFVTAVAVRLRSRPHWRLPAAFVACFVAYSIYVGGDAWEGLHIGANRFITPVMPLVFAFVGAMVPDARDALARRGVEVRSAWLGAGTLLVALSINGALDLHTGRERTKALLGIYRPAFTPDGEGVLRDTLRLVRMADERALVATVWAGIPAYHSTFRMVDTLGYNDSVIARGAAAEPLRELEDVDRFNPGHVKWSFEHTLGHLRPDIVFQTWRLQRAELREMMSGYGYVLIERVWVREDSPYFYGDR